LNLLGQRWH